MVSLFQGVSFSASLVWDVAWRGRDNNPPEDVQDRFVVCIRRLKPSAGFHPDVISPDHFPLCTLMRRYTLTHEGGLLSQAFT